MALVAAAWGAVLDDEEDAPQPARISAAASMAASACERGPRTTLTGEGRGSRTFDSVQAALTANAGAVTFTATNQVRSDLLGACPFRRCLHVKIL